MFRIIGMDATSTVGAAEMFLQKWGAPCPAVQWAGHCCLSLGPHPAKELTSRREAAWSELTYLCNAVTLTTAQGCKGPLSASLGLPSTHQMGWSLCPSSLAVQLPLTPSPASHTLLQGSPQRTFPSKSPPQGQWPGTHSNGKTNQK